jgi:hypothetical protein
MPFSLEGAGWHPDELMYYRTIISRFGSFWNVEWCITNEWELFRPDEWVSRVGSAISQQDRAGLPLSVHGHGRFPFGGEDWCTHAIYQAWDAGGGYEFMRLAMERQNAAGTLKPVLNDEFGYEDHYTPWGGEAKPPARNADSRRRLAWEIVMAGAWPTTGESASDGSGGWINGLRSGPSELLLGHQRMKEFFEALPWDRLQPAPELSLPGEALVMADGGSQAVVWMPIGRPWDQADRWTSVRGWSPSTGEWSQAPSSGSDWVWLCEA